MANSDNGGLEKPPNFEPLDYLRDVMSHKINSSTVTLDDVITTLNKAQIRIVPRLNPPRNIRLPRYLSEARFKPRSSSRIQVSSMYQVFGIAELLEKILVELPAPTILRCRRVNKFFKVIIDGTKSVHQALFRIPLSAISQGREPRLNPFIEMLNIRDPCAPSHQLSTSRYTFKFDEITLYSPQRGHNGLPVPAEDCYTVYLWLNEVQENTGRPVDNELCSMLLCQPPQIVTVIYSDVVYEVKATTLDGVLERLMEKIELEQRSGN